ncbi:MAG TPA: 2-phosphosulfolactate phosphatase [Planctomycetaceae bacterium]|nr:2-phosphosulfolactate phosphatase [Planctomycetaceae bacterium]
MPIEIQVAFLPCHLESAQIASVDVAVVIDTFRFTTTAATALAAGAECVATTDSVESARAAAAQDASWLLCGERHCKPIDGFAMGNSPLEYTAKRVSGRKLLFTTTNGTRAVTAANGAPQVWLASLVNRHAACRAIGDLRESGVDPNVMIICAGTDGMVATEDVLAAGAIIDSVSMQEPKTVARGDSAHLALAAWQRFDQKSDKQQLALQDVLKLAAGGANLIKQGYASDVTFCSKLDSINAVPISQGKNLAEHIFTL